MTPALTEVLTIPQVAKRAGWSRERMWRYLSKVNTDLGGGLLRNTSRGHKRPRWTVTIAALQVVAPQWFHDPESLQRQLDETRRELDETRSRVVHLEKVQALHTEWLSDLSNRRRQRHSLRGPVEAASSASRKGRRRD